MHGGADRIGIPALGNDAILKGFPRSCLSRSVRRRTPKACAGQLSDRKE